MPARVVILAASAMTQVNWRPFSEIKTYCRPSLKWPNPHSYQLTLLRTHTALYDCASMSHSLDISGRFCLAT